MGALVWLAIVLPSLAGLASFLLKKKAGYLVSLSALISFLIILTRIDVLFEGRHIHVEGPVWWPTPWYTLRFGLILDSLSVLMGLIVAFISTLVFIYSIGYMANEEGQERFWFFMGNFVATMLLLVFADNFIMALIGWEGVGLSSFFLIGHYYRDRRDKWLGGPKGKAPFVKPSTCGLKALLTTGIADSFMLVGILLIFALYGTLNYHELTRLAVEKPVDPTLLLLASIFLAIGPLGKSAQFPFQEWLPEAMAGPTPVSALLHSATMVKAGIYLVARVSPFYYALMHMYPQPPSAFFSIAAISGVTTAMLGSMYGAIAVEIKKILAYSTISQLGYMMMALGIAGLSGNPLIGFVAALFHLFSHSLFKAALFLSAGIAIHESHTIYVTEMGGLRKVIPKTFIAMGLAAMSLAGLPPLLGFWSKDALLAATYPINWVVALVAALAAAFTAFYSLRLLYYTFFGKPHGKSHHGHEALIMVAPPLLLASLTLALGFIGPMLEEFFHETFRHSMELYGHYAAQTGLALASSAMALGLGLGSAYMLYFRQAKTYKGLAKALRPAYDLLWVRPFDQFYDAFISSIFMISSYLYSLEMLLNRAMYGLGEGTMSTVHIVRRLHSGDLNRYLGIAGGLLIFLLIFMLWVMGT